MKDESQPEQEPRGLGKVFSFLFFPITWLWQRFIRLWEAGFDGLANLYAHTLRFFLHNFFTQLLAVIIAAVALAAGIYLVIGGFVGSEFFPQQDDGQVQISILMPPGTNLAATDQAARQAERIILSETAGEAVTLLTRVGSRGGGDIFSGGGSGGSNSATIDLRLVDKAERTLSSSEIGDKLREALQKVPDAKVSVGLAGGPGGGGSAIQVQISGPDQNVLIDLANQAEAVIKTVPGTVDIQNNDAARASETQLIVNRDRALDLGLSPAQVATSLRTALSGSTVGQFNPPNGNEIDITLRIDETARQDLTQLLELPLGYSDNGQAIVLSQVANVERTQAPALVSRADRQRVLTVGSGVSGRPAGDVTNDIETALNAQVDFPSGYGFKFIGESETQRESFAQLGQSILLGIALIYMLLVALFQSWLHPLAIMFSLPVTLVGAFGGLWLTGNTLNLISLLGIILLMGVVTKNAILLVDFTNVLRTERGYSRKEALIEAGRLRLRPIIMTTAAIVFALLPLLLGTGAGAESRAPLAAVVIGGNISSTLLTLIIVPVVYTFLDGAGGLTTRLFRSIFGGRAPDETPVAEKERAPDRESGPTPPRRPAPQSGSAISLNPE
jgi:HAE1 family hydrophobic/amphiphilic exporter-1